MSRSGFENLYTKVDDAILSATDSTVLIDVTTAVNDIVDWKTLATVLGISVADYRRIERQSSNLGLDLVQKWLELGQASWSALVKALCHGLVKQYNIAETIAAAHPRRPSGSSGHSTGGGAGGTGSGAGSSLNHSNKLNLSNLFKLLRAKSAQWNNIGRAFDISDNDRDTFRRNLALDDSDRLEKVLGKWLESTRDPTWAKVYDILTDSEFENIAGKMETFVNGL